MRGGARRFGGPLLVVMKLPLPLFVSQCYASAGGNEKMRVSTLVVVGTLALAAGCGRSPQVPQSPQSAAPAPAEHMTPPAKEFGDRTWFQTGGLQGILDPGDAARIRIENPLGDIAVVGGSQETVSATARLHAMGKDQAEAQTRTKDVQLSGSLQDGDLVLTVQGEEELTFVALSVTVPRGRDLVLDASAGKASVEGINAGVTIAGTVGDLAITDVTGPVDVHAETGNVAARDIDQGATAYTSSGSIEMSRVEGPVIARTMTGAIRLTTASNDIIANTQSGSIDLRVTQPFDGSLEARTDGGNIEVRVPSSSNCHVTTMTRSGEITSELPLQDVERNGVNIAGRLGEGKGTLLATTNSGRILLAPVE